ncbi:Transposase IS200 like protein [compost metagenome]
MSKTRLDLNSLSHTKWDCKYHIVFAPKYRRQLIYGKIKVEIGKILRKLCEQKGVTIIEAEMCKDHVHMLVSVPPKISVSSFMGYIKGKSTLMIFDKFANLKYKYGRRNFWAIGYYVDTVGKNKKIIEEYIRNQLHEDISYDQITFKEYMDPFAEEKGEKNNRRK